MSPGSVWVSYPLKQGLKPERFNDIHPHPGGLSQLSIKTRIETGLRREGYFSEDRLSQLSIKTRIETQSGAYWQNQLFQVWVSYPLKQGLKLTEVSPHLDAKRGLSQLSIKTRIETYQENLTQEKPFSVWVSYPLKQGLKPHKGDIQIGKLWPVWVSYPLKQGLKQWTPPILKYYSYMFESAIH